LGVPDVETHDFSTTFKIHPRLNNLQGKKKSGSCVMPALSAAFLI
jgi:hypothetical protein